MVTGVHCGPGSAGGAGGDVSRATSTVMVGPLETVVQQHVPPVLSIVPHELRLPRADVEQVSRALDRRLAQHAMGLDELSVVEQFALHVLTLTFRGRGWL